MFSRKGRGVFAGLFLNRRCYSMFVSDENEPMERIKMDSAGEKE